MSAKSTVKKDHPKQVIDSDLPDDWVNEEAWKAMQAEYPGDPDE